jgi:hypothetical protein
MPRPVPYAGFLALGLALSVACSANWNAPLPVTPEPGYPCGRTGVTCEALDGGQSGMCCGAEEQCGNAGTSCPAGQCCYAGDDDGQHLGARRPQTPRPSAP